MLKPTEINRVMNRCIKSSMLYFKEEGTFYPMLIALKKGGKLNVELKNDAILTIKNDTPDEVLPPEYTTEDGERIASSFILLRRRKDKDGEKDDKAVVAVSKEIAEKYDPDVICFITLVITTDGELEIDNVSMMYICYYIKDEPNPMRMYIPYIFKGELPLDKKETIMVGDQTKTINYDITFIDSSWCTNELYSHFFKNPYPKSK